MEREKINDQVTEEVVGGSIIFNADHTTCGRNCNNQYRVNDYNAVLKYIGDNRMHMSEKTMINNMLGMGLLGNL